jgi:hypothetical protein
VGTLVVVGDTNVGRFVVGLMVGGIERVLCVGGDVGKRLDLITGEDDGNGALVNKEGAGDVVLVTMDGLRLGADVLARVCFVGGDDDG